MTGNTQRGSAHIVGGFITDFFGEELNPCQHAERATPAKINQGITEAPPTEADHTVAPRKPTPSSFQAYKGHRRKPGTGCVSQINENLWEGRYSPIWPDGKKHPRNIYTHNLEGCKRKLAEMIDEVKAEIAQEKERLKHIAKAN